MKFGQRLGKLLGGFVLTVIAAGVHAQGAGATLFTTHCAGCHGTDGNGGELGPNIATRVPLRTDAELLAVLKQGLGSAGMPAFPTLSTEETTALVGMLRTLTPRFGTAPEHRDVKLVDGSTLSGLVLNQSLFDLQLLGDDRRLHVLRIEGNAYRTVTSQADWTTYNGGMSGSRYSTLQQIDKTNVAALAPRWMFNFTSNSNLQTTPVVSEGVMYVTSANEAYALDAGSGREIWRYQRARTRGLIGNAAGGANRGAAIAGDRLFMVTDHAHVIALDKHSGNLLWDTEMADWRQNYNATGAPLTVGNLVIAGTSGGDEGVRGFVAAYEQATGKEVWRWWTTPLPGEPGSETWQGTGLAHPAGSTWMTGTYDETEDTLYWTVGNPGPDLIGDDRLGDNLYTDSVVALDPQSGELKWHFQFTPHDVWDYDAQETPALVDAVWQGQPRKLLIQANRNGFFYVLDRTNGEFLSGWQFAKDVTWATGLDANGRPLRVPGMEPSVGGKRVCPSLTGATNWYSTSFNPVTNLYYVQTDDKCGLFTRVDMEWEAGRGFMGGSFAPAPEPAQRVLRAIDIFSGKTAWELPQVGRAGSWGGVLSTVTGLVIFGEDGGALMVADATTGAALWSFQANARWRASPMTYMFDGEQYIAVANGSSILAFALPRNSIAGTEEP
jgi:alcohol dehydrogenase (cytochrome c)